MQNFKPFRDYTGECEGDVQGDVDASFSRRRSLEAFLEILCCWVFSNLQQSMSLNKEGDEWHDQLLAHLHLLIDGDILVGDYAGLLKLLVTDLLLVRLELGDESVVTSLLGPVNTGHGLSVVCVLHGHQLLDAGQAVLFHRQGPVLLEAVKKLLGDPSTGLGTM